MSGNPSGLCVCGCGQKTSLSGWTDKSRGLVRGEPRRTLRGHYQRVLSEDYVVDSNGCWIWQRGFSPNGYGVTQRDGQNTTAHRWYYMRERGPIPPGMHLDHLCCVRACVNPAHLEPVTVTENVRRSRATKLTAEQAAAIRASPERGVDLARRYGISRQQVCNIRAGRCWVDAA